MANDSMSMLDGKKVLITGGTGSLGHALTQRILNSDVEQIRILSRNEFKQVSMESTIRDVRLRFFIGDVRDRNRLKMATQGVDYIIHSAALKHVPTAEYNPFEFINTNIIGAKNIVSAALHCGVKKVITISTDKAVNPINLYGASKLAADKVFIAANRLSGTEITRFSVVRYGNVIGSRGSVIPLFKKILLEEKTKIFPITDEKMTRFWITLKQSVDFVLKSFERMKGGEIFVPKIPSVKITDIATALAPNLSHRIIGIRAGEKIHEILCAKDTSHLTLEFSDHFVIQPTIRFVDVDHDYSTNRLSEVQTTKVH